MAIALKVQIMKLLKEFFENSTIHGLQYVSSTRHFARVFWILTVVTGFLMAALIINSSFESWNKNPVSTLLETLPIDEISFPKVTVCPPQDTYTTLNFDLHELEGMEFENETRNELFDMAFKLYHASHVNDSMKSLDFLKEENRYQNWYLGITKVTAPPSFTNLVKNGKKENCIFNITTSSLSGSFQTRGFGEPFDKTNFVDNFDFKINFFLDYKLNSNLNNLSLQGNISKARIKSSVNNLNQTIKISHIALETRPPHFNHDTMSVNKLNIGNEIKTIPVNCSRVREGESRISCALKIELKRSSKLNFPLVKSAGFKVEWDVVNGLKNEIENNVYTK